jgi:hypothetical protein
MKKELPIAINTYKKAIVDNNTTLFDECFKQDATVTDAGKTYEGIEAIKEWGDELSRMTLNTKVTSIESTNTTACIKTYVEGDFKNSPLSFIYNISLRQDKIQSLDIKVNR